MSSTNERGSIWDGAAQCVVERIAEKWTLLVLARVAVAPTHFLALQRTLDGISRKVLTQTLRRLERDGLVNRRPEPNHDAVEYSLTALGQSLCRPLDGLRQWCEENFAAVEDARRRFDTLTATAAESSRRSTAAQLVS